jgi:hypothetical protein
LSVIWGCALPCSPTCFLYVITYAMLSSLLINCLLCHLSQYRCDW